MTKLSIVFFGTTDFSVEILNTLRRNNITPTLIVTETDKPRGRGQKLAKPPVKQWAEKYGLRLFQPAVLDNSASETLRAAHPDLFLVAAYGKILPKIVLTIPLKGALNIHPSLLPKYRGPSPVSSCIRADDRTMGVSIMRIDEKMDHGPVLTQKTISFNPWPPDTNDAELALAREGAVIFAEILPAWLSRNIEAKPQDESKATYTRKVTKENGRITLDSDAYNNWLIFRAYRSSPGVFFIQTSDNGETRVKVTEAAFENNTFTILRVIPENRKEMGYSDFLRGIRK